MSCHDLPLLAWMESCSGLNRTMTRGTRDALVDPDGAPGGANPHWGLNSSHYLDKKMQKLFGLIEGWTLSRLCQSMNRHLTSNLGLWETKVHQEPVEVK